MKKKNKKGRPEIKTAPVTHLSPEPAFNLVNEAANAAELTIVKMIEPYDQYNRWLLMARIIHLLFSRHFNTSLNASTKAMEVMRGAT